MALFDRLNLRISQASTAVRSGALTQGAFPWERRQMTNKDVAKQYASKGLEVLPNYRKASEKGLTALTKLRRQSLDAFRPLSEANCRSINKELESGSIMFDKVLQQWGEQGAKALQAYREKHYYEPAEVSGKGSRNPLAIDVSPFEAKQDKAGVHYFGKNQLGISKRPAFIDRGPKIEINEGKNRAAVEAALELAAKKWNGEFSVFGTDQYKALCVKIAAERNWTLANPELQKQLEEAKAKLAEHSQSVPSVGPANETTNHVAPPTTENDTRAQTVAPPPVEQQQNPDTPSNKQETRDTSKPRVRAVLKKQTDRSR